MNKFRSFAVSSVLLLTIGCANMTPTQQALATNAVTLASVAARAAATYYGGPAAGQLASDGLYAAAQVAQGYVGTSIPLSVLTASPGVQGVGDAIASQLGRAKVTQSTVDAINRAAAIAQTLKSVDLAPIPTAPATSKTVATQ